MAGGAIASGLRLMAPDNPAALGSLLMPGEPPAVEIVNADGAASAVLVCDHASNRVPQRLGQLGLDAEQLADHIAWDPGAADVARALCQKLDAPLVLSGYSRLVVDCNRPIESAEQIPHVSDGILVPGNQRLTPRDRALRIATLFRPYHQAIARLLDRRAGRLSLLLSIHSFTPQLADERRPWQIAVAYRRDPRLAALLLRSLATDSGLVVGDNQPYAVTDVSDYTIPVHGEGRGLPHVLIEIRQDGVTTPAGAGAWAALLAETYKRIERDALQLCETRTS